MKALMLITMTLVFHVFSAGYALGACQILNSQGMPISTNSDALARLLTSLETCPGDVFALRARLLAAGATLKTTLVDNRGFHNPGPGSFSLFEMVLGNLTPIGMPIADGEFWFGHFIGVGANNRLIANQQPSELMVELISWDPTKGVFNFYELGVEAGKKAWRYRGDSLDIMKDLQFLHRQKNPAQPAFGTTLRCSGCHMGGGPILKELAAPHNDWWTPSHRLPLGGREPDATLGEIFKGLVGADELARHVKSGVAKLAASAPYQAARKQRSLQERLRPLFCPMELNLESDLTPLDAQRSTVHIPAAFFVDPRLGTGTVTVNRVDYEQALVATGSQFPETTRRDADHAWLTPVKATSDIIAVQTLVEQGIIDEEFVSDVLALEMTNPVFSTGRCELLRFVPEVETPGWREAFTQTLKQSPAPAAAALLHNLTATDRHSAFHKQRAKALLEACQGKVGDAPLVTALYRLLAQRREEARQSEISKHPKGQQILEPNFRVIFPEVSAPVQPGHLKLTETCQVVQE